MMVFYGILTFISAFFFAESVYMRNQQIFCLSGFIALFFGYKYAILSTNHDQFKQEYENGLLLNTQSSPLTQQQFDYFLNQNHKSVHFTTSDKVPLINECEK